MPIGTLIISLLFPISMANKSREQKALQNVYLLQDGLIREIIAEVERAKAKHPTWPTHIVAKAAIVSDPAGELIQSALKLKYEIAATDKVMKAFHRKKIREQAIQVAAAAIRFIEALE